MDFSLCNAKRRAYQACMNVKFTKSWGGVFMLSTLAFSWAMNAPTRGAFSPAGAKSRGLFEPREESIDLNLQPQKNLVVTVGGCVNQPGQLVLEPGMNMWQAVQQAGGATFLGSMRKVKLTRDGTVKIFDITKPAYMKMTLESYDSLEVCQKEPN